MGWTAFSCYDFADGRSFLIADVSVECWTPEYYSTVWVAAWAIISIYCFGLLGFNALLLFKARKAIYNRRPSPLSKAVEFLFCEYEPWAMWWEARVERSHPASRTCFTELPCAVDDLQF